MTNLQQENEPGRAKPEKMPRSTYWPITLAFGTAFMLWGLVTSLIVSAVGICIFAVALAGWIKELGHD
jgi:uncharacterized iron-regulated membrane protein